MVKELISQVLENGLEGELDDELGYTRYDYRNKDTGAYLKDNKIISNIAFYNESSREVKLYGLRDFKISEDLLSVTCPNGITTEGYVIAKKNE